jgi:hypothetical protein
MNLPKGRRSEVVAELDGEFAFGQGTWRLLISRDRKHNRYCTLKPHDRWPPRLLYLALAGGKVDQHREKKGNPKGKNNRGRMNLSVLAPSFN